MHIGAGFPFTRKKTTGYGGGREEFYFPTGALTAKIRELDEKFSNGLMFSGDPSGSTAEVVNCRCTSNTWARWALGEEELQTLSVNLNDFDGDSDY